MRTLGTTTDRLSWPRSTAVALIPLNTAAAVVAAKPGAAVTAVGPAVTFSAKAVVQPFRPTSVKVTKSVAVASRLKGYRLFGAASPSARPTSLRPNRLRKRHSNVTRRPVL